MFKKLQFSMNRVYPTLVVSTMSSGKSTVINALVGKELLPSCNRACTAKVVALLDNDQMEGFEIHAVNSNGEYSYIPDANKKKVAQFNDTNEISEMIIEGQIRGVKMGSKSLMLVDTPGINNSMDWSHEVITKKAVEECKEGLILYIINAQQIATNDDSLFLTYIEEKLASNKKLNIIFVVNKMDLLDPQKESPEVLIENCKSYIESKGINNPTIIPVSASSALIFKKVLNCENLSELEEENFTRNFRFFRRQGFSLMDYSYLPEQGNMQDVFEVEGNKYTRAEIVAALYNTGLYVLEKAIDERLFYSLEMTAPKIKYCSDVTKSSTDKLAMKSKQGKRRKHKRRK